MPVEQILLECLKVVISLCFDRLKDFHHAFADFPALKVGLCFPDVIHCGLTGLLGIVIQRIQHIVPQRLSDLVDLSAGIHELQLGVAQLVEKVHVFLFCAAVENLCDRLLRILFPLGPLVHRLFQKHLHVVERIRLPEMLNGRFIREAASRQAFMRLHRSFEPVEHTFPGDRLAKLRRDCQIRDILRHSGCRLFRAQVVQTVLFEQIGVRFSFPDCPEGRQKGTGVRRIRVHSLQVGFLWIN